MNKNKSAKSSKRFYYKMLITTFASLGALVVIVTALSYFTIRKQTTLSINSFESEKANRSFIQIDDYFQQIYQNCYYLTGMNYIPMDQLDTNAKLWQKKIFSNNISSLITSNDHIETVLYQNNDFNIASEDNINLDGFEKMGLLFNCDMSVKKSSINPKIKFSYSANNAKADIIINITSLGNVVLEDNTFFVSTNGDILISKDASNVMENVFEKYKISNDVFKKHGYNSTFSSNGYFISTKTDNDANNYIITIIPQKNYTSQYVNLLVEVIGVGLLFLLFVLCMSYYFISKTYKPIKDIVTTFKYHLPANVSKYEEEIAFINESINNTFTRNEDLEKSLSESIKKLEFAQAEALHSQISPHFLLNTLENIKWMSIDAMGVDNKIENSLVMLNSIISETIRQQEMITTIAYEVQLAKNYIELMQHRFKYPVVVLWDIDNKILDCVTLKFTLQPVIENVMMHAFDTQNANQTINIAIKSDGADILISIDDNGCGIKPETLEELRQSLEDDNSEPDKHIGLKNLNLRIRLVFGKKYGIISLDSNDCGSHIKILIPRNKKKEP